jgi:hypothetical protein
MLYLPNSICHAEPSVQRLLRMMEDARSLTALILAAWQVARVLAVRLVEDVLTERARQPTAWPACPACGAAGRSKGRASRQMMSLVGPVRWQRRVGRCSQGCTIPQVAPFDEMVGVQPPQRTSGELQCLGCALAVFVPFATAARLLGWYCGGVVSPRAVWWWVPAAGHHAMEHRQEELAAVAWGHEPTPEPLTAEAAALPLAVGADGVMVPFRPDAGAPRGKSHWREVKVGVLARIGQHRTRTGQVVTRLTQRQLVAVLGDPEALKPRLWLEALRQGLRNAPQVVWLSDGGRGLWRLCDECFAGTATGIVDFYHAAQNLWKSAAAWLDGRTTQARRWFTWARHRLRHGHPAGVLGDLAEALDVEGIPDTARETLRTVYVYWERHRAPIDYAIYKELGLPLGSGMVESACQWLVQQRFKGVGRRWSEDGFNHLAHLRLAWGNGRFETLFGLALSPHS